MHGKKQMALIVSDRGRISIPILQMGNHKPTARGVKHWAEMSASCFVALLCFVILCRYSTSSEMFCPAGKYSFSLFFFWFSPFLQNALCPIISLWKSKIRKRNNHDKTCCGKIMYNLFAVYWIKLNGCEFSTFSSTQSTICWFKRGRADCPFQNTNV